MPKLATFRRDPAMWVVPALLVLAVLVPYWGLTTMRSVLVTDDVFVSDIFGGEFPCRAWVGATLRAGELPLWIRDLGAGVPTIYADPMTLILFYALPALVAMNTQLLVILLTAMLGTYAYARAIRLTRAGASLAAIGFTYSGFMVTQLKHVSAVEIVSLFPTGLMLLEYGLGHRPWALLGRAAHPLPRRVVAIVLFGLVVGLQILPGFPQTTYYCFLAYGGYGLIRVVPGFVRHKKRRARAVVLLATVAATTMLGVGIGAVCLAAFSDLAAWSERSTTSFEWIRGFAYEWRSFLNFFVPYVNGDVSNGTYRGGGVFWEEYGYVGTLTVLLALVTAVVSFRRRRVRLFVAMLVASFLLVLGPALPGFRYVFDYVPGMKNFRFTTRAMFIVDFSLCILAGIGLSQAQARLDRGFVSIRPRLATLIASGCVLLTFGDLIFHQLRQNAFGDASAFMQMPETAKYLAGKQRGRRYYATEARSVHHMAFRRAKGWANLKPYEAILPLLEPNTNLFWGVSSIDGYSGLPLQFPGMVWGNSNHPGLVDALDIGSPVWLRVMQLHAVGHLITSSPLVADGARHIATGPVNLYEVQHALPRAYVATRARLVDADDDPFATLLAPDFELGRDVLFVAGENGSISPGPTPADGAPRPRVRFVEDRNNRVEMEVDAPQGGILVLTDNFVPVWKADVDGVPADILRANFSQRAIALSPGKHIVTYVLEWRSVVAGAWVSLGSTLVLVALGLGAHIAARQQNRRTRSVSTTGP